MSVDVGKLKGKGGSVAKESTERVRIDVEELQEIRQKRISFANVCIFEVPTSLKDLKKDVYVPKVVGLGPLHHDDTLPRVNQLKKEAVLRTLIKIYRSDTLPNALEKLRNEVMMMKEQIQDCYETPFSFDPDIFILDSCFLLDFFFSSDKSKASYSEIKRDLMMLENQIPLILLQRLLILQGFSDQNAEYMIVKIARNLFGYFFVRVPLETSLIAFKKIEKKPRHLLECGQQFVSGFVRDAAALEGNNDQKRGCCARFSTKKSDNNDTSWSFPAVWCGRFNCRESEKDDIRDVISALEDNNDNIIWSFPPAHELEDNNDNIIWSFPPAHELEKAGIELKRGEKMFFEWKWWGLKGVLTIPGIVIEDSTEVGLSNIIAFEDCLPRGERLVTGFMGILDCLIDKDMDVGVLRRANIIDNLLESDQAAADLVISSCINVVVPDNHECLNERMKAYYNSKWRVKIMEFMDRPFHVMGTLVLGLTIVQTVYSVISYHARE